MSLDLDLGKLSRADKDMLILTPSARLDEAMDLVATCKLGSTKLRP